MQLAYFSSNRLHVVDALRGFAIVSIMLLHNIEHFDVYYTPTYLPVWMVHVDKVIWETLFFLFSGKSYAVFAVLFGLTFFIQSDHQRKKGKRFNGRFAWRLLLLFVFGLGLYQHTGSIYAILIGLVLTVFLGFFCQWWSSHFKHGPFETIWHRLTWINKC